jgi:hypothetical protein
MSRKGIEQFVGENHPAQSRGCGCPNILAPGHYVLVGSQTLLLPCFPPGGGLDDPVTHPFPPRRFPMIQGGQNILRQRAIVRPALGDPAPTGQFPEPVAELPGQQPAEQRPHRDARDEIAGAANRIRAFVEAVLRMMERLFHEARAGDRPARFDFRAQNVSQGIQLLAPTADFR